VSVDPTGLTVGTHTGSVTVSASETGVAPLQIPVTLEELPAPSLSASPQQLYFRKIRGSSDPPTQTVSLSVNPPGVISFSASAGTSSGGNWLSVTPSNGSAPGTLTVSVQPGSLGVGVYQGNVTVTSTEAANSPIPIPVTLTVEDAPAIQSNPESLSFAYQALSPSAPPDQQLTVTTSDGLPATVGATATSSGGSWLSVQPTAAAPGTLQVRVNPLGLAEGSYGGTITITASGYQPETVPVTLIVTAAPVLNALPAALTFAYPKGGPTPLPRTVSVTSTPPGIPFTVSASDPWIHLSGGGATDASISVSVDPTGLAAGSHRGSVSITSSQAGNSPVVVQVDLTITAAVVISASPASLHLDYTQLGKVPGPQPVSISATKPIAFTTSVDPDTFWLSATGGGTTPGIVTVTVDPTGLAPGDYEGQVLIDAPAAANTPLTIPVTITVAAAPLIRARPAKLTFSYQLGAPAIPSQELTITSGGVPVPVSAITSGEPWLSVAGSPGQTPAVFTVTANGSSLTAGTYNATVTVTSSGASNSPITVPVTFIVTAAPTLQASPPQVSFTHQIGKPNPANQQVMVTSSSASLNFSVTASTNAGGSWLAATGGGNTPSIVDIAVNPTSLTAGTYTGTVTLTSASAGNSPLNIPVTLVVSRAITLTASPANLSFTYQPGGSLPASQQVQVTSSGAQVSFSASIAPGASWLSVSGDSLTPGNLTVSVNPAGLAPGDYAGSVVIQSPVAANNPLEVPVSLNVAASDALSVTPNILRFTYLIQGSPPASQNLTVTSTGTPLQFHATVSPGATWLRVGGGGTTPGALQVGVDPTGLAVGDYSGSILVSSTTVESFEIVLVTFSVTSLPNLSTSPSSLSFEYQFQGLLPVGQTLLVTSDVGNPFVTASSSTFSDGPWLSAVGSGNTPFEVAVSVNPAGLPAGVYSGTVELTSSGVANSPYTVPVTFTVSTAPVLTAAPTSLSFAYTQGATAPPPSQQVQITSGASVSVSVVASTSNGVPWLSAAYEGNSTPLNITVSVNPAGLSSGKFTGTIAVNSSAAGNSPLLIPVTFSVSPQPVLQALPPAANFVYTQGGPLPAPLPITIQSTGAVVVSSSVSPPVFWLSVSGGGPTPANLQLTVNPVGLAPGIYTSAVMVTSPGAANSPLSIPVSLQVASLPALTASPPALSLSAGLHETVSASLQVQSTGAQLAFTASPSSNTPWLGVSGGGTTPANITVRANAAGLTPGNYSGAVVITAPGATNSVTTVPVTFTVLGAPVLTVNPSTISFSSSSGGGMQSQTVTVLLNGQPATNSEPLPLRPSAWMTVQPTAGGFVVTADPSAVAIGDYLAGVAVTEPTAANSPILLPVQLSVSGVPVQLSATSVALGAVTGSRAATLETIHIGGGPADFTANATGSTWLKVSPTMGSIPVDLTITADPTGLIPGSYAGAVTIHTEGASDNIVSVVLGVGASGAVVASPQNLAFSYNEGGPTPAAQSLAVSSAIAGIGLQIASADSWLSVDNSFVTTPARVGVTVNASSLAPGQYHSQITITTVGISAPVLSIPVDFHVSQLSSPRISTITNGASFFYPAALAPGLIFSIFGFGLGPDSPVVPTMSGGLLPIVAAGVQVLVNGVPCPLLYVSNSQINAVASFAVHGDTSANVVVQYLGVNSTPVPLTVNLAGPGIFSQSFTGTGAASILNLDNSVNSPSNPAARGSFVAMFAAGGGQTTPPGLDGSTYTAAGFNPQLPVKVQVGGIDAEVSYAGAAPGLVQGALQVNFRIPANAPTGDVPVILMVGNAASPLGVTVSIR
jgi:uncharacterized protein (TIGR03437 family)